MTTSLPRTTVPESGCCSPVMISSSVVLPAPLGPMIAILRPAAICSDTSLNRCCAAKALTALAYVPQARQQGGDQELVLAGYRRQHRGAEDEHDRDRPERQPIEPPGHQQEAGQQDRLQDDAGGGEWQRERVLTGVAQCARVEDLGA